MSFDEWQIAAREARPRVARGGVLIAGGGAAARHLACQVGLATVVSPTNHLSAPDLVLGLAVSLDPERRLVGVLSSSGLLSIAYAELVIAVGEGSRTAPLAGLPVDERGRVLVDETLRVVGTPHVWALGGCAAGPGTAAGDVVEQARRLAVDLTGE